MSNPKQVYQLKVTLDDVKPPIWRRLVVKEDINLLTLHKLIQRAMGWQDYHLHMFTIAGQIYGNPGDDEFGDLLRERRLGNIEFISRSRKIAVIHN